MPIIAVAGAIGAAAIAGADVAAVGLTVATAFEVTAAVGATIGAIGAVTGDKTLSMVGLGLGAVGGVGALASSAGLLGDTSASLFGATPTAAAGGSFAEGLTPATAGAAGDVTQAAIDTGAFDSTMGGVQAVGAEAAGAADASQGTIGFLSGMNQPPPSDLTTLNSTAENETAPVVATATEPNTTLMGQSPSGADTTSAALLNTPPTAPSAPGTTAPTDLINPPPVPPNGLGTTNPVTGENVSAAVDALGKIVSLPDEQGSGIGGLFGKIAAYAGNHPVVALGALQAGGSLLQGLTSTLTPAQVNALNAQAAANQAAANMATQQQQNLAAPKAVATSSPVTGTPGPLITQGPAVPPPTVPQMGLMNQPPRLAPVTGVPA